MLAARHLRDPLRWLTLSDEERDVLTGYDHALAAKTSGRPVGRPAAPGGLAAESDDGPTPPDFSHIDDTEIIQRGHFRGTARALARFEWLRRAQ